MQGYLYFIIRGEDRDVSDDENIYIKIGKTKSPMDRISQYITHHLGPVVPMFYKVWLVENDTSAEVEALEYFNSKRIAKGSSPKPTEVMFATKKDVERYRPRDITAKAIAPHTMMPSEQYSDQVETMDRFEEHWNEIEKIQKPTIDTLTEFFLSREASAKILQAPCGIGKTHMTCTALKTAAAQDEKLKVVVVVPTRLIAQQWQSTFRQIGIQAPIVTKSDIEVKRGTQIEKEDHTGHRFRIMTYSSCASILGSNEWTYIFDEAHHTTGEMSTEGSGCGSTKGLVNRTAGKGCKRLFITFTPKTGLTGQNVNSMENTELYGDYIPFPPLNQLVTTGLLPDYRLTIANTTGFAILNATANEIPRARKIIVYLKDIKEIQEARLYLTQNITKAENIIVAYGQMSEDEINLSRTKFSEPSTEVTWLLTCLLLLEGADLPIADTAVLLAPWQTKARLIQLLLRPGRWFPKKPTFNIVVPHDDGSIQNTLAIAGFTVSPGKHRILMPSKQAQNDDEQQSTSDIIKAAKHIWCVSYTEKHSASSDEAVPAEADFAISIRDRKISALQNGLNNAIKGDCVILKGPTKIAYALVNSVGTAAERVEKDGKIGTRTRTTLSVTFLHKKDDNNDTYPLEPYKTHVMNKWKSSRPIDWSWITNPRYNAGNKFDPERKELLLELLS
jgi:superfamily II DNA or RNA helicase